MEGNLYQLLVLLSTYISSLQKWLNDRRYFSPIIVNELITTMGLNVAQSLLSMIKETSPSWYGIIADEATDMAHKEQLNVSIRWVSNDYDIHEDPFGLFCLPNTKAETLYTVITCTLLPSIITVQRTII